MFNFFTKVHACTSRTNFIHDSMFTGIQMVIQKICILYIQILCLKFWGNFNFLASSSSYLDVYVRIDIHSYRNFEVNRASKYNLKFCLIVLLIKQYIDTFYILKSSI